jgi:hypothetical protein
MTQTEYSGLTLLAEREGANRAEYLRRRIETQADAPRSPADTSHAFSDTDRILLSGATRSLGHLAGLMKMAVRKSPALGRSAQFHSILDTHHRDLQALRGRIRALLERLE